MDMSHGTGGRACTTPLVESAVNGVVAAGAGDHLQAFATLNEHAILCAVRDCKPQAGP